MSDSRPDPRPPTAVELVVQSDRTATIVLLIALPIACWAWVVVMAVDMYGPMTGASRWMMTASWDAAHLFLLWAMWAVMMTGMMLPSAAPAILIYGAAIRRKAGVPSTFQIYALAAGYIFTWAVFSFIATVLQRLLGVQLLVSPMMETTTPIAGAALLIVAGVYQLTPFKHACLRACQSPFGYFMRRWRDGAGGAFRMGMEHGFYCVGCCWALMLLLFVGGVMNLAVIGSLTLFVILEKTGWLGRYGALLSGIMLVASGLWMLIPKP